MDKQNIIIGLLGLNTIVSIVVLYNISTNDAPTIIQPEKTSGKNKAVADTEAQNEGIPISSNVVNTDQGNFTTSFDPSGMEGGEEVPANATTVMYKTYYHDFGTIYQDTENPIKFEFTNTGDKPLIIEDAKGSCGCTVPNYPKNPILPGKTGVIDVVYKPGQQEGQQKKTVTITANTAPSKLTVLTIEANVIPKK